MRLSARDRRWLKRRKFQRWSEISSKAERRQALRDRLEFCVGLAHWLAEAGIDPDQVKAFEGVLDIVQVLQDIGDTPELEAADKKLLAANPGPPDGRPGPAQRRDREHDRRLAQEYADGRELDAANCTLREAHIFCVARLKPKAWGLTPGAGTARTRAGKAQRRAPYPASGKSESTAEPKRGEEETPADVAANPVL